MLSRAARATVVSRCDFLRRHRSTGQGPWRFPGPGPPRWTRPPSSTTAGTPIVVAVVAQTPSIEGRAASSTWRKRVKIVKRSFRDGPRFFPVPNLTSVLRLFIFICTRTGPFLVRAWPNPLHTSGSIAAVSRSKQINNTYKNILENANYEHESVKAFILLSLVH